MEVYESLRHPPDLNHLFISSWYVAGKEQSYAPISLLRSATMLLPPCLALTWSHYVNFKVTICCLLSVLKPYLIPKGPHIPPQKNHVLY